MKKYFAVVFLLFFAATGPAQVQIRDIYLPEALQQAKAAGKIVLLMIESEDCAQCNQVAMQGFANTVFGRSANDNCITIRINKQSKDFAALDSLYNIGNSFGLLFLNADGSFLHRYSGSTSFFVTYMEQLNKALDRKEHPDTEYLQLQKDYEAGNRDFDVLYKLVGKKEALQMDHDALTDEMVEYAPSDSAGSLSFLQFIAMQSPVIDSKADRYLRKDKRSFNDAWYLMPQQRRSMINNRINAKSKAKAIKEKSSGYAARVASFTAATYTDRTAGRKSFEKNMMDYYQGIHDTAIFLAASAKYYDQYAMSISVDSVKHADSLRLKEMFANPPANGRVMQPGGVLTNSVRFAPSTQLYANELNNGAWLLYTYSKDPVYLATAVRWAKRANEFYDSPGIMDTYARLLYKTGEKENAMSWEEKAIKLAKERKMPAQEFERVLGIMRSGEIVTDN